MLQVKKLSDQQTESEEQNATFESFQNIERSQEEGQCFLIEIQQFPNLESNLKISHTMIATFDIYTAFIR